jgi:E3 ubiquitin-protein ligase UBR1
MPLVHGSEPQQENGDAHVEYEQEAWISVFNVTLSLSRVVKVYAEAMAQATTSMLCNVIKAVARDIVNTCTLPDITKYDEIRWTTRSYGGAPFQVIDFDVLTGWVSFRHSEHWLLAELRKRVQLLTTEKLGLLVFSSFKKMLVQVMPEMDVQIVMEFPL